MVLGTIGSYGNAPVCVAGSPHALLKKPNSPRLLANPTGMPSQPVEAVEQGELEEHSTNQLISSTFALTQPRFQQLQQTNLIQGFPGALQSILRLRDLHITYAKSSSSKLGRAKGKPAKHVTVSGHPSWLLFGYQLSNS